MSSKHVPDEILVRFRRSVPPGVKAAMHASLGARDVARYATVDGLHLVKLPRGVSVKEAIKFYQRHSDVLYAEPNYIVQALDTPNDPLFGSLWGLENSGQTGGTHDADIDATSAWGLTTGSRNVVVAVIDTGIDYTHPDLANNMFRNTVDCGAGKGAVGVEPPVSGGAFSPGAGASQAVTVRFTPTQAGSAPGAVSFTSSAGDVSRAVTGTGTPLSVLSVTPSSLTSGTVQVGASKDGHFTVTNTGVGTLTGSASTSSPFSIISGGSFSLGPGASQQVNVRFRPATPGASVTGMVSFTSDGGNASRAVTGTVPPASIIITSPNGGEIWNVGIDQTIYWTFSGLRSNVRIDLSRDGGLTRENLSGATPNDNSQPWNVTGPPSTQARIRVCDLTQAVCDTSNGDFSIQ